MDENPAPVGRVLMVGFEGTELDSETTVRLKRIGPGGVILFGRNLDTPQSLARLVGGLRECLPEPTLLAIDQEGGRVSRLGIWTGATPTATRLAGAGAGASFRFGRATGATLRSLGFNVDFAPVVDLCSPATPNGIGDRSFGTDPADVVTLAGAFLEGLQAQGVAGCLKHFPGLGDTAVDSHQELPVCRRELDRLEAEDLLPYRRLGGRAAAVMIAHAVYPALESDARFPASLSATIVERLLKGQLGYRGLVVSDDLEMGAVAPLDRSGSAAVAAVAAGCDMVLYCSDLDRADAAREALIREAQHDRGFRERIDAAARTVRQTAARWPAVPPDLAAWDRRVADLRAASALG